MDIVIGLDPSPIKLGWTLAAIIAVGYFVYLLIRTYKDMAWVRDPANADRATKRREEVVNGYLLIFWLLWSLAFASFLVGFSSLLTPAPPRQDDQPITIGLLIAVPMLFWLDIGLIAVGQAFVRSRKRTQSAALLLARELHGAQKHEAETIAAAGVTSPPPAPSQESSTKPPITLSASARDPTGQLDIRVDVEVKKPDETN